MSSLLADLRAPEVERIEQTLHGGGGLITVAADTAHEAVSVARLALARLDDTWSYASVDAGRAASTRDFAIQLARSAASLYLGNSVALDLPDSQLTIRQQAALGELVNLAVPRILSTIRGDQPETDVDPQEVAGWGLDLVVRRVANGMPTVLMIESADDLVAPPRKSRQRLDRSDELLWLFRGRLQHAITTPTLLFVGGPATTDLVTDPEAGFFGWGTDVVLRRPEAARFERAVSRRLESTNVSDPNTLGADIADLSEGSIPTAESLLELLRIVNPSHPRPVDRAWELLLEMSAPLLRQTVRAMGALDKLALPAAMAIAWNRKPYRMPEARYGSEVAKALATLRISGFAVSKRKGEWRLTDPVLAAWLRQPRMRSASMDDPWARAT